MPNAPAALLTAIFVTSFLVAGLLGFVIASYVRLSNKYIDLKNRIHDEDRAKRKITDEILHKSYREAQDFVLTAKRKSEELIKDSQIFTTRQEEELKKSLDQVSNQQLEVYQNTLKDIKDETLIVLNQLLTDTKRQNDDQIRLLMDQIRQEIIDTSINYKEEVGKLTEELKSSFDVEHEAVRNELSQYKKMMTESIDEKIVDVVKEVVTEVVSAGLNLTDREDMIIRSLGEAKKKLGLDDKANEKLGNKTEKPKQKT